MVAKQGLGLPEIRSLEPLPDLPHQCRCPIPGLFSAAFAGHNWEHVLASLLIRVPDYDLVPIKDAGGVSGSAPITTPAPRVPRGGLWHSCLAGSLPGAVCPMRVAIMAAVSGVQRAAAGSSVVDLQPLCLVSLSLVNFLSPLNSLVETAFFSRWSEPPLFGRLFVVVSE